jgi:hypothetical protein
MDWIKEALPWTGLAALLFTWLNWRRASCDPERLDIAVQVADMKNRVRAVEAAILLNLRGEGTDSVAAIQHLERVTGDDLCELLKSLQAGGLIDEVRIWSRAMTSDPFPRSKGGKKEKKTDLSIISRETATAKLIASLEKLRVDALRRKISRSRA